MTTKTTECDKYNVFCVWRKDEEEGEQEEEQGKQAEEGLQWQMQNASKRSKQRTGQAVKACKAGYSTRRGCVCQCGCKEDEQKEEENEEARSRQTT